MNITVPFETSTLAEIKELFGQPISSIQYSPDRTQVNIEGGDISLAVNVKSEAKSFRITGKAMIELKRHDIPQLKIERLQNQQPESIEYPHSCISFNNARIRGIFVLWKNTPYLGTNEIWKNAGNITYAAGVLLNFPNQISVIFAASNSEPDVLILTSAEEIKKYMNDIYSAEFLAIS